MMNLDQLRQKIRWAVELDPRTGQEIAESTGIGRLTLYGCYRANGTVSVENLVKVCDQLGFDLEFTLKEKS